MNLEEYKKLCEDLGQLCKDARGPQAPGGWSGIMTRAAGFVGPLQGAVNAEGLWHFSRACEGLEGKEAAAYGQEFAVYEQIKALAGDIGAGVVSCPEGLRAQLVWRLNGLYSDCLEVSRACLEKLPQAPGLFELINAHPKARKLAEELRAAGYLDSAYKYRYIRGKNTRVIEGRIAQTINDTIGDACTLDAIGAYWGIEGKALSSYAGNSGKIEGRLSEILNKY